MTWLTIVELLLQLAAYFSRRVEQNQVERAFGDALKDALSQRADAAVVARDDVMSGRVQPTDSDPNRRD